MSTNDYKKNLEEGPESFVTTDTLASLLKEKGSDLSQPQLYAVKLILEGKIDPRTLEDLAHSANVKTETSVESPEMSIARLKESLKELRSFLDRLKEYRPAEGDESLLKVLKIDSLAEELDKVEQTSYPRASQLATSLLSSEGMVLFRDLAVLRSYFPETEPPLSEFRQKLEDLRALFEREVPGLKITIPRLLEPPGPESGVDHAVDPEFRDLRTIGLKVAETIEARRGLKSGTSEHINIAIDVRSLPFEFEGETRKYSFPGDYILPSDFGWRQHLVNSGKL